MKTQKTSSFPSRLRPASAVVLSLFAGVGAWAAPGGTGAPKLVAEVEFNDTFLQQPGGSRIDVSRFNKGNVALPGNYRAELYVNEVWLGRAEVTMRQVGEDSRNVQPCFDRAAVERMGVDLARLSPQASGIRSGCVSLPDLIPDAHGIVREAVAVPFERYDDPRFNGAGWPCSGRALPSALCPTAVAGRPGSGAGICQRL
ncbi:FimD/PapC N-terminal domain-containing protein [Cupriavidus necator]|uniref:FimD/PapC N-terminal domain-containing protein n=1 Tax=Cupriavidus necator TaxID=106590 RepID=UPI003ECFB651